MYGPTPTAHWATAMTTVKGVAQTDDPAESL